MTSPQVIEKLHRYVSSNFGGRAGNLFKDTLENNKDPETGVLNENGR